MFYLETYPQEWKESNTLVLRKPGKPSYTEPGAYRPIALLDTISKVLSACVAEDLTKFLEIHDLLPPNHFGCHPGQTTTDALQYLIAFTKDAWRKSKVVGALFLDIKAAFPSNSSDYYTACAKEEYRKNTQNGYAERSQIEPHESVLMTSDHPWKQSNVE